MPDLLTSEVLGNSGVFGFLKEMETLQSVEKDKIYDLFSSSGVKTPDLMFDHLTQISVIFEADRKVYLSPKGHEMWWLLRALNGGDLKEAFQHLRQLNPHLFPYEIVTEGMTSQFIHDLASNPKFRRVLICSPWVSLKRKVFQRFSYAIYKAQEISPVNKVDITLIARPIKQNDPRYKSYLDLFNSLKKIGVEIILHEKLHSKLYIRDPGTFGGISQAIFGSENLTGKRNIELGIRITNDTAIINKLITYFFDLYQECKPFRGE